MCVFGALFTDTVVLVQAFIYIGGYAGIQAIVCATQDVNNPRYLNACLLISWQSLRLHLDSIKPTHECWQQFHIHQGSDKSFAKAGLVFID